MIRIMRDFFAFIGLFDVTMSIGFLAGWAINKYVIRYDDRDYSLCYCKETDCIFH